MIKKLRRFAGVGIVNTVLDVGIYTVLSAVGVPLLAANFISTSCGLINSFFMHGRFTFRSQPGHRQIVPFLLVTCCGLWVIQPVVIRGLAALWNAGLDSGLLSVIVVKCLATIITLAWNYVWYSRVVFATGAKTE